jgi:hypothetical protein
VASHKVIFTWLAFALFLLCVIFSSQFVALSFAVTGSGPIQWKAGLQLTIELWLTWFGLE